MIPSLRPHSRGQEFHSRRAFRTFQRSSGETIGDLLLRVRLNLLSQRIQRRVVAGHRSSSSQEQALAGFVRAFKSRWQVQTYCATQYEIADCGRSF